MIAITLISFPIESIWRQHRLVRMVINLRSLRLRVREFGFRLLFKELLRQLTGFGLAGRRLAHLYHAIMRRYLVVLLVLRLGMVP